MIVDNKNYSSTINLNNKYLIKEKNKTLFYNANKYTNFHRFALICTTFARFADVTSFGQQNKLMIYKLYMFGITPNTFLVL